MKMKSTKRWYGIIVLLVIGVLILSSMSLIFTNQSFKQKWKWYESKEGKYKVKYPADWVVEAPSSKRLPQIFLAYTDIGKDLSLDFQVVCTQAHFKESLLYELTMESEEKMKKKFPDYTCLEITNITLDGFPAIKIVGTFTDARSESFPPFHEKEICITSVRKGITYVINFNVATYDAKKTAEDFDKYLPLANEMIDSFKFI
jgi:hypothetical protein